MNENTQISHDARSNFGLKGWWVIIFSLMNWYMYGGLVNSSMNTVVPELAEKIGVDSGNLLSLSTPAGMVAMVFCLILGLVVAKIGVRITNGLLLILGAVAVFAWASASTLLVYVVTLICMVCLMNGVQLVGGNMTITNWFPKKKGIAIGWATMGLNLSSATFVTILVAISARTGNIKYSLYTMAALLVVLAIVNFTCFKNYPEDCGAYPDNDPTEKRRDTSELNTGWTTKSVLKQKITWFLGIGNGLYGMITIGFVSTFIPSMMMKGFTQPQALTMMTIASVLGLGGSYICGWLDQKFGVKTASIIYGVWVIVGIIFFFIPGNTATWIYIIMLGLSIGGSNNYPPSMTAQVYGRDGSVVAFPVVFFMKGLICVLPYLILGQSLARTGSYNVGWGIFIGSTVIAIIIFALIKIVPKKDPIEDSVQTVETDKVEENAAEV